MSALPVYDECWTNGEASARARRFNSIARWGIAVIDVLDTLRDPLDVPAWGKCVRETKDTSLRADLMRSYIDRPELPAA